MKAQILILGLLVSISSVLMGQSNSTQELPNADVQVNADNNVVLRCVNADNQRIQFLVYNHDGQRILSKRYKGSANMKLVVDADAYDLGELTFKVKCNNEVIKVEKLTKMDNGLLMMPVEINKNKRQTIENNQVLLSRSTNRK